MSQPWQRAPGDSSVAWVTRSTEVLASPIVHARLSPKPAFIGKAFVTLGQEQVSK